METRQMLNTLPTRRAGVAAAVALAMGAAAPALADEKLADLAERVSPAVVTVLTDAAPDVAEVGPEALPEFFRRFGAPHGGERGQRDERPMRRGVGSGFVIDAGGWIVTNNHVVDNADRVTVRLSDDRSYEAEVVGTDPQTDLALLRITPDEDLPSVDFGDSDALRVGEDVMAVGNPFGLGGTVTAGIVSAKGRDIAAGPYADFIQTDAAINKGNSGGPLFDMDGDVVGVNSAIFSPNGGSVGIGFAVASNVAAAVIDDLRDDGVVSRGFLGVTIQSVTPEIAEAMGLDEAQGALVSSVSKDGPSEGKLQVGDVIVALDDESVPDSRTLPRLVSMVEPGEATTLTVLRDGDRKTVRVTVGSAPTQRMAAVAPALEADAETALAARVADLTPERRERLGIADDVQGALIAGVKPGGPAARAGLRRGDVVVRVGGEAVTDADALMRALKDADGAALLLVRRGESQIFVPVEIA
jgi:serine protease Do